MKGRLMAKDNLLRIAVVSDLHAHSIKRSDNPPSNLCIHDPEQPAGQHPISALNFLITNDCLRADAILCAGDMGDKADRAGIKYVWSRLETLRCLLKAELIVGATGNHDLDSRYVSDNYDAKGYLQTLDPPYPVKNERDCNKYWARNYLLIAKKQYRVLLLNSSAYHGAKPDEIDHGRITEYTLDAIENELKKSDKKPINICLTHHHPHRHEDLNIPDYEVMQGGSRLLDLLSSSRYGRWMVIHGHKHFAKVTYAQGTASSPLVFSVGSFSGELYGKKVSGMKNQFYIVEIHLGEVEKRGLVGKIRSWDWSHGKGWVPSTGGDFGLPRESAFGFRSDLQNLATTVASVVNNARLINWTEVLKSVPDAGYLIARDYVELKEILVKDHGLQILEDNGLPVEIGRSAR